MTRHGLSTILILTAAFGVSINLLPLEGSTAAAATVVIRTLPEPSVAVGGQVESSSCVAGPVCVSLGWNHHGNSTYYWAARFRHHDWSKLPEPPNGGSAGTGDVFLSCATTTWCMATGSTGIGPGNHPIADELIGATWQSLSVPTPRGSTDFSLYKLSCQSPMWCIAVGSYVANKKNYVDAQFLTSEVWNGTTWRNVTIVSPRTYAPQIDPGMVAGGDHPTAAPQQLSCISSKFCVITGFWKGVFVEEWNGHRWSEVTAPDYAWRPRGNSEFSGGTCFSSVNCIATGGFAVSNGAWRPLIERWNGRMWKIVTLPVLPEQFRRGTGFRLTQVECSSADVCIAFGDPGIGSAGINALKWNGQTWSYVSVAGNRARPAILCLSRSNCESIN